MNVIGLTPMLTVRDSDAAVDYYTRAFGALELTRFTAPTGHVVAELALGGSRFYVVDENRAASNMSPDALGGTSVRMNLLVDDPDAAAERAVREGGSVVFSVSDQPYGLRQGRIADPFGHHWLLGTPVDGPRHGR